MRDLIIKLILGVLAVLVGGFASHACYDPPQYTPTEQAAMDWAHKHLGDSISAICEGSACMVWATHHSGRSSHTSPPILLDCAAACVPDLRGSVAAPRATP